MKVVSTGRFDYELDEDAFVDLQHVQTLFASSCDDLWDKGFRLYTQAKTTDFAYRDELSSSDVSALAEGFIEVVSVLNNERQAVAFQLVQKLMHQAFSIGAARAIEGLDPVVRQGRTARMAAARAGKDQSFSPDKEAAILQAIADHGPKVGRIQTALHKQGLDVSDDTIRRRKKTAAPNI